MSSRLGVCVGFVLSLPAASALSDDYQPDYLDKEDPLHVDVDESLDYAYAVPGRLSWDGDLRGGYFDTEVDNRDGSQNHSGDYNLRLRYGGNYSFNESLRLRGRLAATCSDSDCSPSFETGSTPSAGSNIDDGDVVVDEFYLAYQHESLSLALGRQQTRILTRGGVFATALTRLTSPNVAVNWTDGLSLRYQASKGWESKLIAQYNDEGGSSTLARAPLDFDDDDSRVSYVYMLESRQPWGVLTQRGIDVTYMPSALLTDGNRDGPVDDYWNIVGRLSAMWPLADGKSSLMAAGQLGYAPETPTEAAVGIGGENDADGLAWQVEASWMDFRPGHSLGINLGVTDAGWLLSPSYRPNEETLVLRYHWRPQPKVQLEVQARWREDQDALAGSERKRDTFDWRVRLTWAFDRS